MPKVDEITTMNRFELCKWQPQGAMPWHQIDSIIDSYEKNIIDNHTAQYWCYTLIKQFEEAKDYSRYFTSLNVGLTHLHFQLMKMNLENNYSASLCHALEYAWFYGKGQPHSLFSSPRAMVGNVSSIVNDLRAKILAQPKNQLKVSKITFDAYQELLTNPDYDIYNQYINPAILTHLGRVYNRDFLEFLAQSFLSKTLIDKNLHEDLSKMLAITLLISCITPRFILENKIYHDVHIAKTITRQEKVAEIHGEMKMYFKSLGNIGKFSSLIDNFNNTMTLNSISTGPVFNTNLLSFKKSIIFLLAILVNYYLWRNNSSDELLSLNNLINTLVTGLTLMMFFVMISINYERKTLAEEVHYRYSMANIFRELGKQEGFNPLIIKEKKKDKLHEEVNFRPANLIPEYIEKGTKDNQFKFVHLEWDTAEENENEAVKTGKNWKAITLDHQSRKNNLNNINNKNQNRQDKKFFVKINEFSKFWLQIDSKKEGSERVISLLENDKTLLRSARKTNQSGVKNLKQGFFEIKPKKSDFKNNKIRFLFKKTNIKFDGSPVMQYTGTSLK